MSHFQRTFENIEQQVFDLLIVGGGIVGVSVAEEAARRGLKVVLFEQGDFGAGTSAGCFRLLHGGVRYLQHLDLGRMYESLREQTIFRRRAPHLIRPLSFLLPCYENFRESRKLLEAGLALYELITYGRNRGFPPEEQLPKHSFIPREDLLKMHPGLRSEGLTGAVRMWDCQMEHAERLTLAVARTAGQLGATMLNYVTVDGIEQSRQQSGARGFVGNVRDLLSGKKFRVSALSVVNATGAAAGTLAKKWLGPESLGACPELSRQERSKGFQLVLPPIGGTDAVAVRSSQYDAASKLRRGPRNYFLVPWREYTLAGTTDESVSGDADEFAVSAPEVRRFIAELAAQYSSKAIEESQVLQTFGGYLPAEEIALKGGGTSSRILRDDILFDHRDDSKSVPGFMSVVGVKYTTARSIGERVADWAGLTLRRSLPRSVTATESLIGGGFASQAELEKELVAGYSSSFSDKDEGQKLVCDLVVSYGSEARGILERAAGESGDKRNLSRDSVLSVQTAFAIEQEMAVSLSDVIFRRTFLGSGRKLPAEALRSVSLRCQELLGWDDARREAEEQRVNTDKRYAFLTSDSSEEAGSETQPDAE